MARAQAIWFTNLEHSKRQEKMILYKKYNPTDYPKYDNYNAIEVSKTADIPMDYDGAMGVPITFWINTIQSSLRLLEWEKTTAQVNLAEFGKVVQNLVW